MRRDAARCARARGAEEAAKRLEAHAVQVEARAVRWLPPLASALASPLACLDRGEERG